MHRKAGCATLRILAVSALLAAPALAKTSSDRVQINHDIFVEPGQKSGDLVCVNCSVFVRGEVAGDVVAVHGNVVIEQGARVAGDVVTVLGNLRLQGAAQVGGDAVAVGGTVRSGPQATVGGDVTSLAGAGWTLLIVLLPLAFMGGFIALIVWLIARMRRPTPIAA
jgi:Polymer-forming cytoskeletal